MSLQYYHNWNLTMIRAQCIHPTRWRPLPSNTCGSSLFALPLHQTCANKMQRSSWTICGRCLDKATHVQTMYYIRIPTKIVVRIQNTTLLHKTSCVPHAEHEHPGGQSAPADELEFICTTNSTCATFAKPIARTLMPCACMAAGTH